jgi:2-haloacid dehalogenase
VPFIETVLFDLGGVLIHWDPRLLYRKLLADEAAVEQFLAEVCNHRWNSQMDAGKPFAEGVAELAGEHPDKEPLIRAYWERWDETLGGPVEATVELLARLRGRGRRLFALSNWSAETFPVARARYEFLGWFEDIVVSGEVKLAKPDPAIFELVRARCGLDAGRTLFIDDSEVNVRAAEALGFETHHFRDPESLGAALAAHGLL